ncbi:MAG TPA: PPOX class F420-dependent oxidoreductase [Pseudonocardia sp.]|nr:PPOX class F420-dependent oxidoreductase [Pseudonocardia sp.]
MAEIPEGYEELLIQPNIAHLATVRPDGQPAVSPMWFSWDGELLRFTHTTRRVKFRNIEANPYVAVSVLDPAQPYQYLQVRGVVESLTPDPAGEFFVELAKRYGMADPTPPADSPDRVVIAVRPFAYSKQ